MDAISIRPVRPRDAEEWLRLRLALWPGERDAHAADIQRFFDDRSTTREAVLVAHRDGRLVGLAELSLRAYAEGCHTSPVAFLEGWFVSPEVRRSGVGRALLEAAEAWGRDHGCREFASDTEVDNDMSTEVHRACGFEEAAVIRCFRKSLE